MKFIFHNPHHSYWFKKPSGYAINKSLTQKYEYLFDHFYRDCGRVYVYIDKYKPSKPWYAIRNFIPPIIGFYAWVIRNRLNPLCIVIVADISKVSKGDLLFTFIHGTYSNQEGILSENRLESNKKIEKSPPFKLVHLTHFIYNAKIGGEQTNTNNVDKFVAESNLSRCSGFFQKHFSWYRDDCYVLPFIPNRKFVKNNPFGERKNKAVALGTITSLIEDKDFISYFGNGVLQPGRVMINDNKLILKDVIDSFISKINEINPVSSKIIHGQVSYRSLDLVKIFNDYRMFIVPEELSGLPGIGFVEGMKCGSAYIGLNSRMYFELGLVDKVNYIAYDGSISDLISKINHYKDRPRDLEKIANNGYLLACERFSEKFILQSFLRDIKKMVDQRIF